MSRLDDYEAEMAQATLSDLDVERLLSGMTPENDEAAQLVALLDLIRVEGDRSPSDGAVARVASQAASLTQAMPTVGIPTRPSGRTAGWRLRPQLAVVAGAIVVFGAFSGVAVAADGAVPGDVLYGIDRALEKIGIGAGGAEERLEEARSLLSEGDSSEALRHATEVLTEEEDGAAVGDARAALEDAAAVGDARAALEDAAVTLEVDDQPTSTPAREDVAVLLDYIRANHGNDVGADGKEFGQGVADLAHDINPGGNGGPPSSDPGQGNDRGNGNDQSQSDENLGDEKQVRENQGGGNRGANGDEGSTGGDQAPGNSGTAPGRDGDS